MRIGGSQEHLSGLTVFRWYLERIQQAIDKARLECGSDQARVHVSRCAQLEIVNDIDTSTGQASQQFLCAKTLEMPTLLHASTVPFAI